MLQESTFFSILFDILSLRRSHSIFFFERKSLSMEETLSQYLKNKSTYSTMRSQMEKREKFVEAAEFLMSILLMLLILVLNQEKLDFPNF